MYSPAKRVAQDTFRLAEFPGGGMTDANVTKVAERAPFWSRVPRGMITVTVAVVGLFVLSALIAP